MNGIQLKLKLFKIYDYLQKRWLCLRWWSRNAGQLNLKSLIKKEMYQQKVEPELNLSIQLKQ